MTVEQMRDRWFEAESKAVAVRPTAKSALAFRFVAREVWAWEPQWSGPRRRLLMRRNEDGSFLPSETSWEKLAYMQAQRFWIEHCFHEAKS